MQRPQQWLLGWKEKWSIIISILPCLIFLYNTAAAAVAMMAYFAYMSHFEANGCKWLLPHNWVNHPTMLLLHYYTCGITQRWTINIQLVRLYVLKSTALLTIFSRPRENEVEVHSTYYFIILALFENWALCISIIFKHRCLYLTP